MSTPIRNSNRGGVFDVRHGHRLNFFSLFTRQWGSWKVVNLRPPFRHRYPILAGIVFILIAGLAFGGRSLFTRAEVSDFYAATCLGTWENPQRAQGPPESSDGSVTMGADISALFTEPTAQIFCGNFIPDDFKGEGKITNVGLTLVWNSESQIENEAAETESVPAFPEEESTPAAFRTPGIFRIAHAEEAASSSEETPPTETSTPPEPVAPGPVPEVQPPADEPEAALDNVPPPDAPATSEDSAPILSSSDETTEEAASSAAAELDENLPPLSSSTPAFLRVNYSLDGTNWFALADVSEEMIPHLTVPLPVTSWDDLRKVQIGIEGVPAAIVSLPRVLLDGMLLEVHYEVPPAFSEEESGNQEEKVIPAPPPAPLRGGTERTDGPPSFTGNEAPSFELDINTLTPLLLPSEPLPPSSLAPSPPRRGFLARALKFLGMGASVYAGLGEEDSPPLPTAANPVIAKVFDHGDGETNIRPQVLLANNRLRINVPQPSDQFVPGKYLLRF